MCVIIISIGNLINTTAIPFPRWLWPVDREAASLGKLVRDKSFVVIITLFGHRSIGPGNLHEQQFIFHKQDGKAGP